MTTMQDVSLKTEYSCHSAVSCLKSFKLSSVPCSAYVDPRTPTPRQATPPTSATMPLPVTPPPCDTRTPPSPLPDWVDSRLSRYLH